MSRNRDHIDMLVLGDIHNVSSNVITYFETESCLDLPGLQNSSTLRQMMFRICPSPLNEYGFRDHVGGGHRDHVYEKEFSVKMLGKVRCRSQSCLE